MYDIITVDYSGGTPTVSGRELHEALEVKEKYTEWFKRMCDYGFRVSKDYLLVSEKTETNNPKNPCRYAGCNLLSIKDGYCERHLKAVAHEYEMYRRDPETHKRYGSEWWKIRAAYIAAHPLCEMCLTEGRLTPSNVVHHRKELSDGGTHDSSNLQSLCVQCHNSVTMTTTNEKRRRG